MKNRNKLASLMIISAVAVAPAYAQDPGSSDEGTPRTERALRLPSVEAVMSMRERLSLSEDQIARLDDLRAESVERRSLAAAELAEMRSRLNAGQIQPSELMAFREDRQAQSGDLRAEHRSRLESVLDAAQLETLQQVRVRGRSFSRGRTGVSRGGREGVRNGRRSARAGRGARGARGVEGRQNLRGSQGQGWDRTGRDGFRRGR